MLQIIAYLIKAFFTHKVFAFGTQVAAVDDGVDEGVWVRAESAAAFDAADALEAEGVPDAARREVGFVDEVENGVGVALLGFC